MDVKCVAVILFALALPAVLSAQQEAADTAVESATPASADILAALELPTVAEILRERGVPVEEIEAAMERARERAVPPGEMTGVLEETARSVEENGPIENFGAFVQERLAEGLRGRALAEAIRAEHARRGIGQGRMLESRRDRRGDRPGSTAWPCWPTRSRPGQPRWTRSSRPMA